MTTSPDPRITALGACASLALLGGCSGGSSSSGDAGFDFPEPVRADYAAAVFGDDSATITNPWLAFGVGRKTVYEGETEEGREHIDVEVLAETRPVDGIDCAVVLDRVTVDGELVEETRDWYAQDVEGNVWYMGEDSNDYEDGELVSTAGSWEAGRDVAGLGTPAEGGVQMYGNPMVGQVYYQEYYEGEALDAAEIVDVAAPITLADGTGYETLRIKEWNPYEPDGFEYKHYALNVGLVRETDQDGLEPIELVSEQD